MGGGSAREAPAAHLRGGRQAQRGGGGGGRREMEHPPYIPFSVRLPLPGLSRVEIGGEQNGVPLCPPPAPRRFCCRLRAAARAADRAGDPLLTVSAAHVCGFRTWRRGHPFLLPSEEKGAAQSSSLQPRADSCARRSGSRLCEEGRSAKGGRAASLSRESSRERKGGRRAAGCAAIQAHW